MNYWIGLYPLKKRLKQKSRRNRKPRASVKERPKKQNPPQGPQKALKGGRQRKRKTPESEEKGPTEEEMLLKVANVLRDAIGLWLINCLKGMVLFSKSFNLMSCYLI